MLSKLKAMARGERRCVDDRRWCTERRVVSDPVEIERRRRERRSANDRRGG